MKKQRPAAARGAAVPLARAPTPETVRISASASPTRSSRGWPRRDRSPCAPRARCRSTRTPSVDPAARRPGAATSTPCSTAPCRSTARACGVTVQMVPRARQPRRRGPTASRPSAPASSICRTPSPSAWPARWSSAWATNRPRRPSADFEAYQAYVKGRYFWSRFTPRRRAEGVRLLRGGDRARPFVRAAPRGPGRGLPRRGRARTCCRRPWRGHAPPRRRSARSSSTTSLAEAHVCLGAIALFRVVGLGDGRTRAGARRSRSTPAAAGPHQWYALYLHMRGRFTEAQRELERAPAARPALDRRPRAARPAGLPLRRPRRRAGAVREDGRARAESVPAALEPRHGVRATRGASRTPCASTSAPSSCRAASAPCARRSPGAWPAPDARRRPGRRSTPAAAAPIGAVSPYQRVAALVALGEEAEALSELERAADAQIPGWSGLAWTRCSLRFMTIRGFETSLRRSSETARGYASAGNGPSARYARSLGVEGRVRGSRARRCANRSVLNVRIARPRRRDRYPAELFTDGYVIESFGRLSRRGRPPWRELWIQG